MVDTDISGSAIKGPYHEIKKDKEEHTSSREQQQQYQQQASRKNDKYGSWGSIFKNKDNFVDMHIC
ncbi:hypothetical protein ACS0PU_003262 [Formica fusca]